ncbi:MAG: WG repeat-containing protein [Flavobacteriales bacterium]
MKTIIIVLLFIPYLVKSQSTIVPYEDNYLFGFMNLDTQIVITPKYVFVRPFAKNGLAKVLEEDGQFGFIDTTGNYVIEPQYNLASSFTDHGKAVIYQNERYHLIDSSGDITLTFSQDINYINFDQMNDIGFVAGCKGYIGDAFYSWDGEVIIPPIEEYRTLKFINENIIKSIITRNPSNDGFTFTYETDFINTKDNKEQWTNITESEWEWLGAISTRSFIAYNNKYNRADTIRYERRRNKKQINFRLKNDEKIIKYDIYYNRFFNYKYASKRFGDIYASEFNTIETTIHSETMKVKNDSIFLYPSENWEAFLQDYGHSANLKIEYYYKGNWISPFYIQTRAACLKGGARYFWKPSENIGIRIEKPNLNTGNITTQARFSIDVINAQNDTLKMYSDPFPYKVYGGLLEHPKPFLFRTMVLH